MKEVQIRDFNISVTHFSKGVQTDSSSRTDIFKEFENLMMKLKEV